MDRKHGQRKNFGHCAISWNCIPHPAWRHRPPCGAGKDAIAITTDGKILACPIAPDFQWNVLGDFRGYEKIEIGEPCKGCDVYGVCGGRCLFAYKEKLWGEEGFREICEITKFTISEIRKYMDLLSKYEMELRYPPYNNTTEIIP